MAMDAANLRIGLMTQNRSAKSRMAPKATATTPRSDTIWAIGKVRSSRKNCGHVTIAAPIANTIDARVPSRRSTWRL